MGSSDMEGSAHAPPDSPGVATWACARAAKAAGLSTFLTLGQNVGDQPMDRHTRIGVWSLSNVRRKLQVNSGFSPSLAWWHLSLPTKDLLASLS